MASLSYSFGQQQKIDSLENLLRKHTVNDTIRVGLLIELAEANIHYNDEKVLEHGRTLGTLSDSLDFTRGEIASSRLTAQYHLLKSDFETALDLAERVLEQAEGTGESLEIINIMGIMGSALTEMGDYHKAFDIYQGALMLSEKIGHEVMTMWLLQSIGAVYYFLGEYDKDLYYSLKALETALKIGDRSQECRLLGNIASTYEKQGNYERSLPLARQTLTLARELKNEGDIAYALTTLGSTNIRLGNYLKAATQLREALSISKELDNKYSICHVRYQIARVEYHMGRYEVAKKVAKQSLELANMINLNTVKKDLNGLLSDIAVATADHKMAYAHYKTYKQLSDSLLNQETLTKITNLENKYTFEIEKQRLNAEQDRNSALQLAEIVRQSYLRKTTGIIAIMLLALTLTISYGLMQKHRTNRYLIAHKNEIEAQNASLVQLDRFKRTVMGNIVNELKTPLNTIINQGSGTPEENLKDAKGAGIRMLNMVFNILDVYKYRDAKLEPKKCAQSLSAIAEEALGQVGALVADKRLRIEQRIDRTIRVSCERELIRRTMINLLTSTITHTSPGGKISLDATLTDAGMVEVCIKQMTADRLPHVPRYHESGGSPIGDNNLGLSFCKLAVEAHGGTIRSKKNLGQGMGFTFTLEPAEGFELAMVPPIHNGIDALGETDKKILRPYLEALSNISVYEVGRFKKVISKLPMDIGPIAQWREGLEESVRQLDGERYAKLIQVDKGE